MKKFIAALVLLMLLAGLTLSPLANIDKISYQGDYQLTEADAMWLRQQNWIWSGADWLAQNLPSRLTYENVTITRNNIFSVEINAIARTPFIAVKSGGYFVIIDVFGIVLSLSETADAPYVIEGFEVVSAVVGKPLVADEMQLIERAVQIVYMFKENTDYEPSVKLVDKRIIQKMTEDIYIDFGQGDDVELQFNNALVAYQNMIENEGTSGIVNVSNPKQCIIEPLKR